MSIVEPYAGRRYAFYHTDTIWGDNSSDFIKSSLLFFDGVALSVPTYELDRILDQDLVLAQPLHERKMLVNIEPSSVMNDQIARKLADAVEGILLLMTNASGRGLFGRLLTGSISKGVADASLNRLLERLSTTGPSGLLPGSSVLLPRLDHALRGVVVYLYAQMLARNTYNCTDGLQIEPITDSEYELQETVHWLLRLQVYGRSSISRRSQDSNIVNYGEPGRSSATHISAVRQDLQEFGIALPINIARWPLDEVLDFKESHGPHLRAYMKGLLEYVSCDNQASARRQEIIDYQAELKRKFSTNNMQSWAIVTLSTLAGLLSLKGDATAVVAIASLMTAVVALPKNDAPNEVQPFSYLLKVQQSFS